MSSGCRLHHLHLRPPHRVRQQWNQVEHSFIPFLISLSYTLGCAILGNNACRDEKSTVTMKRFVLDRNHRSQTKTEATSRCNKMMSVTRTGRTAGRRSAAAAAGDARVARQFQHHRTAAQQKVGQTRRRTRRHVHRRDAVRRTARPHLHADITTPPEIGQHQSMIQLKVSGGIPKVQQIKLPQNIKGRIKMPMKLSIESWIFHEEGTP